MRQILTDATCKTKPPATGRLEIADLRQAGLALRITSNGARSFAFRFRHPDTRQPLRITIGTYPTTTLEAARKRAREMAAQVEAGISPIEHKRVEREKKPLPVPSRHWQSATCGNTLSATSGPAL
jgi:Arm DNA-binding domain